MARTNIFLLWLLLVLELPVDAEPVFCAANEFMCTEGRSCIAEAKVCNGRRDCLDNSDEKDCDMKLCQKPNWFKCNDKRGTCVPAEFVCNELENCPGGEDELNCEKHGTATGKVDSSPWFKPADRNCSKYEYTCQKDKTCIPLDFMCDGKGDCNDGSDETDGCDKAESMCRGFRCANRKCLESKLWVCDGVDDCGDGSDELKCVGNCKIELGKFLCRDNETCVDLQKVCDDRADCPDKSDESTKCSMAEHNCTTKKCPKQATCHMISTTGPECICPKGYRYSILNNSCVDIDECAEVFGVCTQGCVNTEGSYRCTCADRYTLKADDTTCTVQGGDAHLFYTTQKTVIGVNLKSRNVYKIADNLTKVIGVAYDGQSVYWTNIQHEAESIVKANADGSKQEVLLTAGLDAPEDLAVDWLTGNIYFSDNVMRHIAVCTNDGHYCVVLVVIDVHQPRGITLWPQRGQMFWTDWGSKPIIARASMDGTNSIALVTTKIHWPNGVALDVYNERVFWVDAKLGTIESIRPDGTDRRMILTDILKHPYGIAIFEEKLYWSDWGTKSVHSADKYTGKNHEVVVKDRTIYAIHVYHSANQADFDHPCRNTRCTHLCLLAENNTSTCACPDGMSLSVDQLRCIRTRKIQKLFLGIKNYLIEIDHTTFGRHTVSRSHSLPMYINDMVYNSVNGTVIIVDNIQKAIYEFDVSSNVINTLARNNLGNVTGLAFDHLAYNLYWTDAERHVVEVLSLSTLNRAIVSFFSGQEIPIGISVLPEDGKMLIALRSHQNVHIDQKALSGMGDHIHVFEDDLGMGDIKFISDHDTETLYWADTDNGRISFSDFVNLHAQTFRGRLRQPFSVAVVGDDLFWSQMNSPYIYWTHKSNLGPLKRIELEAPKESFSAALPARIPLLSSTKPITSDHPCQHANGGCSHVCVTQGKFTASCLCPAGHVFKDSTNRTCIEVLDCEFRCRSGDCLTMSRRCNGHMDCPDNSDELDCDAANKRPKVICTFAEFTCHDATQCVNNYKRCDGRKDCTDGSDEDHCEHFVQGTKCHRHQHVCDNSRCVDLSSMCDGIDDCGDNSDELNCNTASGNTGHSARPPCSSDMYQCISGTCIAKSWECDGKLDCADGSDEHDKCGFKDCSANMSKCKMGQCIDTKLVCDGHNDCSDNSDEADCDDAGKRKIVCGDEDDVDSFGKQKKFQCPSKPTLCLDWKAKCNGTAECPRGEDEVDCNGCSFYEFQCVKSKECIPKEFRCDREKDCQDGSDELNCERLHNATKQMEVTVERACEPGMFDCKDGRCIDQSRVCDGMVDCDTAADEPKLCQTACANREVCNHKCRPTASGAVCSCFDGYRLHSDQRKCIDVNECDDGVTTPPCAQLCENTHGSYRCSCYPDFMLRTDKTSCKSIESEHSLLFSTYNEVRSMSEHPLSLQVVWTTNDSRIVGFDVNIRKRLGYFTTDDQGILYEIDMETGALRAGLFVDMPSKVSVDWITGNVYVISRTKRYEIRVCSFERNMCNTVVRSSARNSLRTLAVDPINRRLFYVITKTMNFGVPTSEIVVSDLDGTKHETFHTKDGRIEAIEIDTYKKLLYFVDSHAKSLHALSYEVGSQRLPVTIIRKENALIQPSGLSIYENVAFIINVGSKEVVRCNLYGDTSCNAFSLNVFNAENLVVNGSSRQNMVKNPCEMAKCSGMCVLSQFSYECMCHDNVVTETEVCTQTTSSAIVQSALGEQDEGHNSSASTSSTTKTVCFILLIIAMIAAGMGYIFNRRKLSHRSFNINMHFQNPLSSGSNKPRPVENISYESERQKLQFSQPIHRIFGRSNGSEIFLDTKPLIQDHDTTSTPHPSTIMEHSGNRSSRIGQHFEDDARARLVS